MSGSTAKDAVNSSTLTSKSCRYWCFKRSDFRFWPFWKHFIKKMSENGKRMNFKIEPFRLQRRSFWSEARSLGVHDLWREVRSKPCWRSLSEHPSLFDAGGDVQSKQLGFRHWNSALHIVFVWIDCSSYVEQIHTTESSQEKQTDNGNVASSCIPVFVASRPGVCQFPTKLAKLDLWGWAASPHQRLTLMRFSSPVSNAYIWYINIYIYIHQPVICVSDKITLRTA